MCDIKNMATKKALKIITTIFVKNRTYIGNIKEKQAL